MIVAIDVNANCVNAVLCMLKLEFVEIIVLEGLNVKVSLKAFRMLVIRNFQHAVKHGSLFMEQMQVGSFVEFSGGQKNKAAVQVSLHDAIHYTTCALSGA